MQFKNIKIRNKILITFGILDIIIFLIGIIGFIGILRVSESFDAVTNSHLPTIETLQEIEISFELEETILKTLLISGISKTEQKKLFTNLDDIKDRQNKAIKKFESFSLTIEEKNGWENFLSLQKERTIIFDEIETIIKEMIQTGISHPMELLKNIEKFQCDLYALQIQISNNIRNEKRQRGGHNASSCDLGKWLSSFNSQNPILNNAFNDLKEPHKRFHNAVRKIQRALYNEEPDEAWLIYENEIIPYANKIRSCFSIAINETEKTMQITSQAIEKSITDGAAINRTTIAALHEMIDINTKGTNTEIQKRNEIYYLSTHTVIAGLIFSLILTIILSILLIRSITPGLNKDISFVQHISEGILTNNIEKKYLDRNDEIGMLAQALNNMNSKLRETINNIFHNSNNISQINTLLNQNSFQVSQGVNEQVDNIENVSHFMEEIISTIHQNTRHAQEANKMSQTVSEHIQNINTTSLNSLESVQEIASKINFIKEIASQTNLLALNATIEAARAGEHGREFTVIATEIRKLADHSKVTSDEIIALSMNSVNITEQSAQYVNNIIPEIEHTTQLIQEITAASLEQDDNSKQITTIIQQLNQTIEKNISYSDQTITDNHELSNYIEQLKEIIKFFKI